MLNKKGIAEWAVALYCVGAFLLGVILYKPATSVLGISSPKTTKQAVNKKEEKRPTVYFVDDKGNVTIGYTTVNTFSNVESSAETQLTFWQKIKNLGFIGIVLIILGFLFPPVGAILMFIWNKVTSGLKNRLNEAEVAKEELSIDAKKIVLSVDEGLAVIDTAIAAAKTPEIKEITVQLKKDFLTAMSRKQDSTTKLLVAELKND
jgi:hypothetical protein